MTVTFRMRIHCDEIGCGNAVVIGYTQEDAKVIDTVAAVIITNGGWSIEPVPVIGGVQHICPACRQKRRDKEAKGEFDIDTFAANQLDYLLNINYRTPGGQDPGSL